jgi:outer membrane usher protein
MTAFAKESPLGCLIIAIVSCVTLTSQARAQQAQIANPYGRDVEFTVALRERQTLIGELSLHISKSGRPSISVNAFTSLLAGRITPEAVQALLKLNNQEGLITFDALKSLGYLLEFNDAQLDLAVGIPLNVRPRQDYSVMGGRREDVGDFDPVSGFSFAANMRLVGDYNRNEFSEDFVGSGNLNLLGRLGGIAYQSAYRIPSSGERLIHEGSRLIVDDVKRALRWQIGDIRPFSDNPIGGDDIFGIGVSTERDSLQPEYVARLRGTQTFSLDEISDVTISVNGRVVTRRTFVPGNYNIADFPFVLGRNQIELLVVNSSGGQKRLNFNQFLDSRLLQTGEADFGLAFGVASQAGFSQSRIYDTSAWTLNAHYVKGMSEKLTLGFATTLNDQRRVVLATGVYAGQKSVSSARLGLNFSDSGTKTGVLGFGLVRTHAGDRRIEASRTWRLGLDSRLDFNDLSKSLVNASIGYAWPITNSLNASTDLRFAGQTASVGFQTSYSLTRDLRVDVSLDWRFNRDSDLAGPGISIGLSRSFGVSGQSRGTYNSRLAEGRLNITNSPNLGLGNWSNSIELATFRDGGSVSSSHSALFNRFELSLSEAASWNNGRTSQRAGVSLGSALAYAQGSFAWGRPISDSFAIIDGHKSLGGRTISLESRGSQTGSIARTGLFGPALVSGLGSYAPRIVNVTVDDAPMGYDIGSGTFRVSPPLFGGYRFVVGSDTATTIVGTLLLPNGTPASLVAGIATSLDWPQTAPITVFTNANGQFSAMGLGMGKWSLKMRGVEGSFDFVIHANENSLIDVGTIYGGQKP